MCGKRFKPSSVKVIRNQVVKASLTKELDSQILVLWQRRTGTLSAPMRNPWQGWERLMRTSPGGIVLLQMQSHEGSGK